MLGPDRGDPVGRGGGGTPRLPAARRGRGRLTAGPGGRAGPGPVHRGRARGHAALHAVGPGRSADGGRRPARGGLRPGGGPRGRRGRAGAGLASLPPRQRIVRQPGQDARAGAGRDAADDLGQFAADRGGGHPVRLPAERERQVPRDPGTAAGGQPQPGGGVRRPLRAMACRRPGRAGRRGPAPRGAAPAGPAPGQPGASPGDAQARGDRRARGAARDRGERARRGR